jgi:hypothetical protein
MGCADNSFPVVGLLLSFLARLIIQSFDQAEIQDFQTVRNSPPVTQKEVGRFDVAMNQTQPMRFCQ